MKFAWINGIAINMEEVLFLDTETGVICFKGGKEINVLSSMISAYMLAETDEERDHVYNEMTDIRNRIDDAIEEVRG